MLITSTDLWTRHYASTKAQKRRFKQSIRIQRRIARNGDTDINRRHAQYRATLSAKMTKAELVFGNRLAAAHIPFIFQKGFFRPFHRIYDFYLPHLSLGIEIDGTYHQDIVSKDTRKDYSFLTSMGINTIRIPNEDVDTYDLSGFCT